MRTPTYGNPTDLPIAGDWIAQSHDGIGMFRQGNGYVYLRNTITTGIADNSFFYGQPGDVPIAGHWTGDSPAPAHPAPPALIVTKTPIAPTAVPNNGSGGSVPGGNQIGG